MSAENILLDAEAFSWIELMSVSVFLSLWQPFDRRSVVERQALSPFRMFYRRP